MEMETGRDLDGIFCEMIYCFLSCLYTSIFSVFQVMEGCDQIFQELLISTMNKSDSLNLSLYVKRSSVALVGNLSLETASVRTCSSLMDFPFFFFFFCLLVYAQHFFLAFSVSLYQEKYTYKRISLLSGPDMVYLQLIFRPHGLSSF